MKPFAIRLGVPEMLAYWQHLSTGAKEGTLASDERQLFQKWGQAMAHLAMNPAYPSLHTHEIPQLSKHYPICPPQSVDNSEEQKEALC